MAENPAALEGQITKDNDGKIKAKMETEADDILHAREMRSLYP